MLYRRQRNTTFRPCYKNILPENSERSHIQQVGCIKTCGLIQLGEDIDHRPAMRGYDPRVCITLKKGSQEIAMFLAFGTPICR
jgi:hypothetical protein